MEKKVWIIIESWDENYKTVGSKGYANNVFEDYNEAVIAAEDLVEYHKKCFPKDFYTNWLEKRVLHYAG